MPYFCENCWKLSVADCWLFHFKFTAVVRQYAKNLCRRPIIMDLAVYITWFIRFSCRCIGMKVLILIATWKDIFNMSSSICYLIVDIEQHQVVAPWYHKVHPGIVSMHHLVFGPVENGVVDRQHGCYCQHFIRTLVPGRKKREEKCNKWDLPAIGSVIINLRLGPSFLPEYIFMIIKLQIATSIFNNTRQYKISTF